MRFSLRHLLQYLDTKLPAAKLLEAITDVGLEVEETVDLGLLSGNLVVGEILAVDPVEGADKIRLATVRTDAAEPQKIVCGAPNIAPGQRVPVAKFGMTFPDGMVLKPRKIRGLESQGMLCSARELGVAEDADGIWILPSDAPVGEPWDALVTIKITPNRPDALSLVGVARDLAAKTGGKLRLPTFTVPEAAEKAETRARVTIEAKKDCPRYTARVVTGVKIGPSPRWLQVLLESAGLRPISNVVDVTNYVMLELGQPLHAFDLDRLEESRIVVRLAREGESMETLDGKTAALAPSDLLICDGKKPVALAGVMGGANSEISEGTQNVLIESAYFRPTTIRRTARRLDKQTDASYRFERGIDPKGCAIAAGRAAQLLAEIAGGTVLKGIVEAVGDIPEAPRIALRIARVEEMLGFELTGRKISETLVALGFEIYSGDETTLHVQTPSHRVDVSIEEDLIEEIARLHGYDKIPAELPRVLAKPALPEPRERLADAVCDAMVAAGFAQAINYSFVSEGANALVGAADALQVRVKNPLVQEQAVMRRSLLPSLLQNAIHNLNHGVEDVRLFEIGCTYRWPAETEAAFDEKDQRPSAIETPMLGAVLCGGGKPNWREADRAYDFFDMKGVAEALAASLGLSRTVIEAVTDCPWLHPGRAAALLVKGERVLTFGELHPAIAKELDLKKRLLYLEMPMDARLAEHAAAPRYSELPKFPASQRDLALVLDRSVSALDIERTIRKAGKEILQGVALFDVYEGSQVPAGKRSLAFSLTFRAPDRTLQDAEVSAAMEAVLAAVAEKHGAAVR